MQVTSPPTSTILHRLVWADLRTELMLAPRPAHKVGTGVAVPGTAQRQQQVEQSHGIAVVVRKNKMAEESESGIPMLIINTIATSSTRVSLWVRSKIKNSSAMYGSRKMGSRFISFFNPIYGKVAATRYTPHRRQQLVVADLGRRQKFVHRQQSDDHDGDVAHTGVSKKLSTTISTAIPTSAESTLVFIKTSPFYRQRINSGLVQGMRLVHCTELPAQLTQVFPLSAGFSKPVIF